MLGYVQVGIIVLLLMKAKKKLCKYIEKLKTNGTELTKTAAENALK